MDLTEIFKISKEIFKKFPDKVIPVSSGGSSRRYWRMIFGNETCEEYILCSGNDVRENEAFCRLARVFSDMSGRDIMVPAIVAAARDYSWYVQTSVGSRSLLDDIEALRRDGRDPESALVTVIESCVRGLAELQTTDSKKWEQCVFNPPFGKRSAMWDLNYFKYEFVKVAGIDFDENRLEDDFERFADEITNIPSKLQGFMYRDFQSRNVLTGGVMPGFIDFQGGRRGPVIYDIVSFLWQAKAGFSLSFRRRMLEYYLSELALLRTFDVEEAESLAGKMAVFRTLQVLGAYGLRGLVEKKAHFIESIPAALQNLDGCMREGLLEPYPELLGICRKLVDDPRFRTEDNVDGLTLEIYSFSYKRGYPEDLSGNGGGFMFDCRGMHNPGRYREYMDLTGLDSPVIKFLEEQEEARGFVERAVGIVCPSVDAYLRRGFSRLQVGFGCTGGRHRSVYCAEHFGEAMAMMYPEIRIIVNHREQEVLRCLRPGFEKEAKR